MNAAQSDKQVANVERMPPADAPAQDGMVSMLERVLKDPTISVERLDRLLEMREAERAREAKLAFNTAMSAAQGGMHAVLVNKHNSQTKSQYASYAALDAVVRPIYVKHGFAVTYDSDESPFPDHIRVVANVTNAGHERHYHVDMPCDGKGAKGGDVMTKTHAMKSAVSYGKATLLPMIFNLAVTDKADDDGNSAGKPVERITDEQLAELEREIDERGVNLKMFLDWSDLESLDMMARDLFEPALARIRMKKAVPRGA